MTQMLLLLLVFLPTTSAMVTCRIACAQCRDKTTERSLREVYCAMCRECLTHERERLLREQDYGWDDQEVKEPPPGCPTAPPCSDDEQSTMKKQEEISTPPSTTTTTTTTTTCPPTTPTPLTCPPIIPCKKKRAPVTFSRYQLNANPTFPGCWMPCMPMCPCPAAVQTTMPATPSDGERPLYATTKAPKNKDFFYVYIGLPKDVVNKIDE